MVRAKAQRTMRKHAARVRCDAFTALARGCWRPKSRGCWRASRRRKPGCDWHETFQLDPHRWKGKTGLLSGVVGAAGGIGGFYLPVIMGIAKESTGSYQMGFATFGVLATCAFGALFALRAQWLPWSATAAQERDDIAINGAHAMM